MQNIEHVSLSDGWMAVVYREWDFPADVVEVWERLSADYGDTGIFISYGWFEKWWRAFGKAGEMLVVVIMKNSKPKGIFPCLLKHGFKEISICSLTNDHSCHYDFLIDAVEKDLTLLNFIKLIHLQYPNTSMHFDYMIASSPNIRTLTQLLRNNRIPFHQYMSPSAPWMKLEDDTKLLLAQLPGRLRNTIQRGRKKAEKRGRVDFEVFTSGEHLDEAVNIMFDVEYKGWKGRNGTAIKCDSEVERFYRSYASVAMNKGQLLIPLLTIDNIPVAADYCLGSGNTIFLLKPGYDESYSHISPGNLLRSCIFDYLVKSGYSLYNFLGACEPWKMEWTQKTHEYVWIEIFPKSVSGWGHYAVKYGWKELIKKSRLMRRYISGRRK
jgi:CelD/BcsL family acetyltransferase involved in cellulose biosynthesis